MIELVGSSENGELLLASHLVMDDESDRHENRPQEYSLVLEGGQKISLSVLLLPLNADNATTASVEIKYQETTPFRAAALRLRQLRNRFSQAGAVKNWRAIPVPSPMVIVTGLVMAATVAIVYFAVKSRPGEQIAQTQPAPSIVEPGNISTPEPSTLASPERTLTSTGKREPSPLNKPSEPSVTREQTTRAIKSLASIERIYVEPIGDDEFSAAVREVLIEGLQSDKRFIVVNGPDQADTAISGLARRQGKRREAGSDQEIEFGVFSTQLLNVNGDVLWRPPKFHGTPDQMASQFLRSLREAINADKRRQKNKP